MADEEENLDDFNGGFSDTTAVEQAKPKEEVTEAKVEQPVEAAPKFVQLTESDWNEVKSAAAKVASYDNQFSKIFGTLGHLQQNMKKSPPQPVDGKVETTTTEGAEKEDPVTKRINDELMRRAKEDLEEVHADWETIIGLPDADGNLPETEFRKWLATQPEAYQKRVNETYSPTVVSKAIDKFKESKKPAPVTTPAKTPTPKQPAAATTARREVIQAAVQPKGDGGKVPPAKSEVDHFNEGFAAG